MDKISQLAEKYPLQKGSNNPYLRTKSELVQDINQEIKEFSLALQDLMLEYDGVGLAAPQIGVNLRIISVYLTKSRGRKRVFQDLFIMINPEIIDRSKETNIDEEGCLSFPGLYGNVERYNHIVVKFLDVDGKEYIKQFSGYNARVIQHEIDHLNAVLLPDRIMKKKPLDLKRFISLK